MYMHMHMHMHYVIWFFFIEIEEDANDVSLLNVKNKAYSDMQMKDTHNSLLNKSQSESNLNKDGRQSSRSYSQSNKVNRKLFLGEGILQNGDNQYLYSQLGLFGTKQFGSFRTDDQPATLIHSRTTTNMVNSLTRSNKYKDTIQDNDSASLYGIKPDYGADMKRYGTMEKLNVNDLVLLESTNEEKHNEEWEVSLQFHQPQTKPTEGTPTELSPYTNEGSKSKHIFANEISIIVDTTSEKDNGVSTRRSSEKQLELTPVKNPSTPARDEDEFTEQYLSPNGSLIRNESFLSIGKTFVPLSLKHLFLHKRWLQ